MGPAFVAATDRGLTAVEFLGMAIPGSRARLEHDRPEAAVTYSALAHAIGAAEPCPCGGHGGGPGPLAYVIPCHRVLRSTGGFGGYRWGPARKRAMLARESARLEDDEGDA